VGDGHGVSSIASNSDHLRRILEEIGSDSRLSQRAIATRLGVSLGRANQLFRQLVQLRWIRSVSAAGQRHAQYMLTPAGAAAHERLSREHLEAALAIYGAVRDRVRHRLEACAIRHRPGGRVLPAIVLYGVGDLAQIAFACAADLGVPLVGFADDSPRESFLGLPVRPPRDLRAMALDGRSYDCLLVASFVDQDAIRGRLEEIGFPLERVSWL
jgi:DNA-binding MarR family transcriptional regulator